MATTPLEVKKPTPAPAPAAWQSLRSEMDELFDRFAGSFGVQSLRRMFDGLPAPSVPAPAIDIVADAGGYKLTAELPGMTESDIVVELNGDMLTLKGEKKQESEHKDKTYTMSERSYGAFQRSFALPDGVDRDKLDAKFANGVLTISMPKLPAAVVEPKKIEVKSG